MDIGPKIDRRDPRGCDSSNPDLCDVGLEDFHDIRPVPVREDRNENHDQLPNVEEYKASHGISRTSRSQLKATLIAASMIIVATILITVGIVLGKNSQEGKKSGDSSVLPPGSGPVYDVATFVSNMGWAEVKDVMNPRSPQWKAANWLANDDPMHMGIAIDQEYMNRFLLATIYFALGGEEWFFGQQLNFLSAKKACEWNMLMETKSGVPVSVGVSCRGGSFVKEIFLPRMGLKGELPPQIGLLLDLEDLNLYANKITGAMPEKMKHLHELRTLIINSNELEGNFPDWLTSLSKLTTLNLSANKMIGELPVTMKNLSDTLETLALENNAFTGSLNALQGFSALQALYLGTNKFSGEFLDLTFVSLNNIEILDISDNELSGPLPASLLSKSKILVVDLHGNKFSGSLPSMVQVDGTIQFLALNENQLTGVIDDRIAGLTNLAHLDLSKNKFSGSMPTVFGQLKSLKYLFLAFNDFTVGTIPAEYGSLPLLVDLSLQATNRNGAIPYQLGVLQNIVLIDLNSNALSGEIPPELGGLQTLKFLLLKNNKLSGSVPATFKALTNLDTLLIDENDITGGISNICAPARPKALQTFVSDCKKTQCVVGTCCTKCCNGADCDNLVWFSDVDPIAATNYGRTNYDFLAGDDVVFPVVPGAVQDKDHQSGAYQGFDGYYSTQP
jgi:Leucine-rich repeat (LRR) protein